MMDTQEQSFNISIKDFQIIKKANLTFLPGLNCIVGQSNNGKSAILRAAKACIYNTPGTNSVRLGTSNYAVGIQNNGHTVILQKGTNNIYKLDGTLYEKIGRTQLPEVANLLGISELNLNGTNEQINFLDQMEKPFLLDRSETDLFRFIVDSGKDNNVTKALKSITQDRQQITRDITMTEGATIQLEETLARQEEALTNVDNKIDTCLKVIAIGPKISRLNSMKKLFNNAKQQKEQLDTSNEMYNKYSLSLNKTDGIVKNIQSTMKKRELVKKFVEQISQYTSSLDSLRLKSATIGVVDSQGLTKLLNRYNSIIGVKRSLEVAKNELESLSKIKVPEMSTNINDTVSKYKVVSDIVVKLKQLTNQKENETIKYNKVVSSIAEIQKEIDEVGVCPTCGKPLHD